MKNYRLLLTSAAVLTIASPAWSEEFSAICAQVMPCDESGELMPEYQDTSSPCYETFRLRCEEVERSVKETGVCRKQNREIERLKKEVRLLKRARRR